MPALETSRASPSSPDLSPPNKSVQQPPSPSLAEFSASLTTPISPLPAQQQQQRLVRPASPPSYNSAVRHSPSPAAFHHTADVATIVHPPTTTTPLTRPSTSPASLSSPADDARTWLAELREAQERLLIQKHAIAAALGAELTALKEERMKERRQHAVVMRRMEEEVRRMEERATRMEVENHRIKVELDTERAAREHDSRVIEESPLRATVQEESKQQSVAVDEEEWDDSENEPAAVPIFHSEPPSSRPSICCPQPTRQSSAQPAQREDDVTVQQMLAVIQQLSQQIAAIRLHTEEDKRDSKQLKQASEAKTAVYGPGRVWREYEPLMFSAVHPIVFHRTRHYTHYDVNEWGRSV